MNKIDIIRFLLDEVEQERKRFAAYSDAVDEAEVLAEAHSDNNAEYRKRYYAHMRHAYKDRIPRKSIIEQNLKKIRQLSLELMKEEI